MLDAHSPLFGIGIEESIRIPHKCRNGKELIVVRSSAGPNVEVAKRHLRSWREGGEGSRRYTAGKTYLPWAGSEVEEASWPRKSVVRLRIIDYLRVVNSKAPTNCRSALTAYVIGESDAGGEVLSRIGERLLLVSQSQVQSQIGHNAEVVLRKQSPESVVDRVSGVAIALGVAVYVSDVADIRLILACCSGW